MEGGGDDARRAGLAEQHFGIGPEIEVLRADEDLRRPLSIRAVIECGRVAAGGDGDRPVLAVIGDGAGRQRPRPVRVIGQRVAIGVIGDGRAADGDGGMGMRAARGIDQCSTRAEG